MADPVTLTNEIFAVWGAGGFNDANSMDNCRKYFTAEVVFDFEGNFKNATGYKVYNGYQGVLDWCAWVAENCVFNDFDPTVFPGPAENTAMTMITTQMTCKPTGKTAPPSIDMDLFTFSGGKCSRCQMFFGSASAIDAIFA